MFSAFKVCLCRFIFAADMIYSLKSDQSWYEAWWAITEAWDKLFCTGRDTERYNLLFSYPLYTSTASAFVPICYICISTKLCLQNLFKARLNFAKSRRSAMLWAAALFKTIQTWERSTRTHRVQNNTNVFMDFTVNVWKCSQHMHRLMAVSTVVIVTEAEHRTQTVYFPSMSSLW